MNMIRIKVGKNTCFKGSNTARTPQSLRSITWPTDILNLSSTARGVMLGRLSTAISQLTLLMEPACSACYSKLRTKGINYNESWKIKNMFVIADFINFCNGCDVFTCKNILYTRSYVFYFHGCNVIAWNLFWASVAKPVLWQLMILLPCTLAHTSFIPMGAMYLYMQECFLHSLIWSYTLWGHQFLP